MASSGPPGSCCPHAPAVPGAHQTAAEMDFERGVWSAALDGDLGRVRRLLVEKRVDPSQPDLAGYTALLARCRAVWPHPLHRASYCGHVDVARLLLAHGADPGIVDDDGMTSLHKAAERGHRELCELLLRHSPGLKGVRDRRARSARDLVPGSGALRDLLEP
ncbi:unnamed protein product [Eretmochelys imbricata]